jgi:predicted Zn-dependent protease
MARRAYAIAPESPEVNDTLGWTLAGKGDVKEAVSLLSNAHQKRPDDPAVSYHFAAVLAKEGQRNEAMGVLKPALASGKPFDDRLQAEALEKTLASGQ